MQKQIQNSDKADAPGWCGNTNVFVVVLSIGAALTIGLLTLSYQHHQSHRCTPVPLRKVEVQQEPIKQCRHYEELIKEATSSKSPPQLSKQQLHWISDEVWSAGQGKGIAANFLVFGLGLDSIMWRQVNCRGRSVFLENWANWIEMIVSKDPALEVYKVDYNTSVSKAGSWFEGDRWSVSVPANVSEECYDVILVDAPQGFAGTMPGRMMSAQLASNIARRCVAEGRRQRVVVFLHDMNRPLEQRIAEEVFHKEPTSFYLGLMKGPLGDLSAWEFSKNIRPRV